MKRRYRAVSLLRDKYAYLFPGKSQIDEHRYLMAIHLNRTLEYDEIVHHKDGDGLNNDLSNLELIRRGEHSKHHNTGRPQSEDERYLKSVALKGKSKRPEHVEKVRQALLARHAHRTEEEKLNLSIKLTGNKRTEEQKENYRSAWTPERRLLQGERNKYRIKDGRYQKESVV